MTRLLAILPLLLPLGAAELLQGQYRAVTIEFGKTRFFRVKDLERVTGATGKCIHEGVDGDEPETFWLEAECSGVRTTLVWKKDGTRMHVMACAEDEKVSPDLLKLRKQVQADVKKWNSVTACVRNGHVEVWGWVNTEDELKKMADLEPKYGWEKVKNKVERIEE